MATGIDLAGGHHVKGGEYHWRHGWIPLDAEAKAEKEAFEKRLGHKASGGEMAAEFGRGHHEGVKEASTAATHHGFTQAQIEEAQRQMTARAKARQAADRQRHERGLTGAQAAEEILTRSGHAKAQKDTAHADRAALVKHMRAEEQREAAEAGYTGKIRHGGKAPKETTKARPGRKAPARGRQRATKGLSPGIEAQRQELLRRITAMQSEIETHQHDEAAAKGDAHAAGKAAGHRHFIRGLLRHLVRQHSKTGTLLGPAPKTGRRARKALKAERGISAKRVRKLSPSLRKKLEAAAVRQHGKGRAFSAKGYGVAAGLGGLATTAAAMGIANQRFGFSNGGGMSLDLAADSMAKASTPEPVGPHALWKKKGFHLPFYIEHIANDLREKRGMDESRAIAVAIGAVRRWARGGGKVDANTRAAAAKALAEWEATKARAKSVKSEKGLSNGAGMSIDLAGFKPSQQRAPAGTSTGGQWAAQGGKPPTTKVQSKKFKDWHAQQVGHYPPGMTDPAQRKQWDNWFKFFSLSSAQQRALMHAGKAPKKPKGAPRGPRKKHFSNGGSVTQLDFADTEPDADDMMAHVRAATPKGHGMKVPQGTAPAKVAKMHGYLHRQGNAKHSHSGGKAMNMSHVSGWGEPIRLDRAAFDEQLAEAQRNALEFSKLSSKARKALPKSAFAYVDAQGNGHFPIHDANHVRNALSRIGQGAKFSAQAKRKVLAAAKRMGIGKAANMSLAHDGLVRSLQLANLPHAQFPRVQTNPKPSQGLGKPLASHRQPTTTTAHAGNEMFPPKARKGGGPGNSLAPYRQPKGASPPPGGPQAPLRLPKGSGSMEIYTPANPAEHSHVMKALRGARALRRQGRTAQANSVMAGLVRQVTGRARRMPSGQVRAHTIREVTAGLAQMAKGAHGITTSGPTGVKKGSRV